jgi:DNA repair protein RecO (recombination protein O)
MPPRERIYSTHALLLRRRDVNDADRVVTVLTPRAGKLELIAKGVRKTTSRKSGHLEPFMHVMVTVAQARTWDIITEVATVETFRNLRLNLAGIAAASYVVEVLDSFVEGGDECQPIWELALFVLRAIDEQVGGDGSGTVRPELLRWFDLQILSLAGFAPQLFRCVACARPLEPTLNFFGIHEGGVFCPQCGAQRQDVEPIQVDALKMLRFLQSQRWDEVSRVQIRPGVLRQVESLLSRYLLAILERHLRSVDFLRRLQHPPERTVPPPP